jgi:carboxyl-terminal processing protease
MDKVIEAFQEATGDKYATYINKEDMILEEREFTGEYYGVGITLTYPEDEDYILITEVQENSPAFEAGITEGTKLLELNNVKSRDEKCQEVFKEIASGKVDVVNLKTDKGEYNIKPRKLDLKTVKVKYEGDIAVIKIDNFTDKTDKEFLEIYEEIEKNPEIKGLLFDVRNNGGGDKAAVTEIVDRLAPKGLLYTEKYNSYSNEVMSDSKSTNLPIAILGNSRTASASELLIMTLQDTNDAVLVGETTYGKSTILIYVPFDDGSAVMLSTGFYYPPSDRYIEGVGIEPDIEDLENPYETAIEYLRKKIDGGK